MTLRTPFVIFVIGITLLISTLSLHADVAGFWLIENARISHGKPAMRTDAQVRVFELAGGLYFDPAAKEDTPGLVFFCPGQDKPEAMAELDWISVAHVFQEDSQIRIANPGMQFLCSITPLNNTNCIVLSGDWGSIRLKSVTEKVFKERCLYFSKTIEKPLIRSAAKRAVVRLTYTNSATDEMTYASFYIDEILVGDEKLKGRTMKAIIKSGNLHPEDSLVGIVRIHKDRLELVEIIIERQKSESNK